MVSPESYKQYVEDFERGASFLEYRDHQDESLRPDGTAPRSTANAQRRGIIRYLELEAQCWQENWLTEDQIERSVNLTGKTPAELRVLEEIRQLDEIINANTETLPEQVVDVMRWQREKRDDVVTNFFYSEWVEQLGVRNPIRTYGTYALFVACRAVLYGLTSTGTLAQALREKHPRHLPFPEREKALAFKNRDDYEATDWVWYLANVEQDVPGTFEAAQTLLINYSDLARAERQANPDMVVESPLPDDPIETGASQRMEVPEETRIEQAISAYTAREGNYKDIADKYGLARHAFRKVLKDRGLSRSRGGNQKGN